jgi:hypothetical protein
MWENNGDPPSKRQARGDNRGDTTSDPRRFLTNHPARQGTRPDVATASLGNPSGWQVALSEQILVNHEADTANTGDEWMAQLKADSMQFLEEKQVPKETRSQESIYKKGIEILIDKIFSLLQRYMYEFNKVAAGTDLHVSGTISGDITEVVRFNQFREAEETQTYFRARFSTKHYSLVLRGKNDTIDFFLIPVARSMALSRGEKEYSPLATLQMRITEDGMMWRMVNSTPPVDDLEPLARWLFQQLVQETKAATEVSEKA